MTYVLYALGVLLAFIALAVMVTTVLALATGHQQGRDEGLDAGPQLPRRCERGKAWRRDRVIGRFIRKETSL